MVMLSAKERLQILPAAILDCSGPPPCYSLPSTEGLLKKGPDTSELSWEEICI